MDCLKAKMASMKKSMDEYEEREVKAKTDLATATERLKGGESEIDQLKRRIQIVEDDVCKVREKLVTKVEQLSEIEVMLAEREECKKSLSIRDENNGVKIEELENRLHHEMTVADRRERERQDAMNRLRLGMDQMQYLKDRSERANMRIENMERCYSEGKLSCQTLEKEQEKSCERDEIMEENRRCLEEKCKGAALREEEALRKQKILQHAIDIEKDRFAAKHLECEKQKRKLELVKKELGDIYG